MKHSVKFRSLNSEKWWSINERFRQRATSTRPVIRIVPRSFANYPSLTLSRAALFTPNDPTATGFKAASNDEWHDVVCREAGGGENDPLFSWRADGRSGNSIVNYSYHVQNWANLWRLKVDVTIPVVANRLDPVARAVFNECSSLKFGSAEVQLETGR